MFSAAQRRYDAAADLEDGADATVGLDPSGRLPHAAAHAFEQGRLSGPVDTDDAQGVTGLDLEADVLQHPAVRASLAFEAPSDFGHLVPESGWDAIGAEAFPRVIDQDGAVS